MSTSHSIVSPIVPWGGVDSRGYRSDAVAQFLRHLLDIREVVDDDDLRRHLADLVRQVGRGEHEVGGAGGASRGADVGGLHVGVDAECAQRLLGVHLQEHRGSDAHAADGDDLHGVSLPAAAPPCAMSVRSVRIAASSLAVARRSRSASSAMASARLDMSRRWPSWSVAASAITMRTGSLAALPNSTGSASVTRLSPVRSTAGDGRAWASAKHGAMTMYGPSDSIA